MVESTRVLRQSAVRVIARREFEQLLRGVAWYLAIAATMFGMAWFLGNDLENLRRTNVLVSVNPFQVPVLTAVLLLAFLLSVAAVISVARDRQRGTLEVLFYGPIDEASYLGGKLLGQLGVYIVALPILLAGIAALSLFTGFAMTATLLGTLAASIVPAAAVIALGLLLSSLAPSVRSAIILLVVAIAVLVGVGIAATFIGLMPIENPSSPIIPVRDSLTRIAALIDWISPFSHLERVMEQLTIGATGAAFATAVRSLVFAALALAGATVALRKRGVRRHED
ncbi:MAG: ABC transporter permease subunit [Nitriliruptoraceae bacterium]